MKLQAWAGTVVAAGLAGCGSVPAASHSPVATSPTVASHADSGLSSVASSSRVAASCYTPWQQADIRDAARTSGPVAATAIAVNDGQGPRLTLQTLAAWFGHSPSIASTPSALLAGWTSQGPTNAVMPSGSLGLYPENHSTRLVLAFTHSLPNQTSLLRAWDESTTGPLTVMVELPPNTATASLTSALSGLIQALRERGKGGLPLEVAATIPAPRGGHYLTYAGPFSPRNLLHTSTCLGSRYGSALALQGGLIQPRRVWVASNANGIRFAFAPGAVVLDSNHDGYETLYWYNEPGISLPGNA